MTTPTATTSNSQMHNDIMAAGSRESKPTRATEEAIPKHNVPETYKNTTLEKRAYFDVEAEAIHMILSGIRDKIYSTVDAYTISKEMWIAIKRLQHGESLNKQDVKTDLFWEFGQFRNQRTVTVDEVRETKQEEKGVPLRAEQGDCLNDTDDEPDEQELEAHYIQPSEQPKTITDTYMVETVDNECVVLANLIANLKLDHDENKKILKQLKKLNASLTHQLNECKSALEESNVIRDRCRSALHD
ncbi:hypothetical protein Tco_1104127 [Tanacetum coccineum]